MYAGPTIPTRTAECMARGIQELHFSAGKRDEMGDSYRAAVLERFPTAKAYNDCIGYFRWSVWTDASMRLSGYCTTEKNAWKNAAERIRSVSAPSSASLV